MKTGPVHLLLAGAAAAVLVLCSVYPFLPGKFDSLSVPLATMAQVFGVVGLVLVPGGVVWLMRPSLAFACAVWSTVAGTCVALVLGLFATLSVGNAFGALTLGTWIYVLIRVVPGLRHRRSIDGRRASSTPLYLVSLPVVTLASQLLLTGPVTQWSRDRAIRNAGEFIADIEQYRATHGRYPVSLQAQHRDYVPGIVGIDRYIYAPAGDSYNLSFEQPRFILDRFGTREWVVYNSRDEHRAYSHTAALLPPGVAEPNQGWYASGRLHHAHWMYFYFD